MAGMCFVIVGKCAVKWVLLRYEFYRDMITPMGRIWIVKTSVVFGPLFVPGTCAIRDEIISTWPVRRSKRLLLRYLFSTETAAHAERLTIF